MGAGLKRLGLGAFACLVLGIGMLMTQNMANRVVTGQIETNARMWSSYFIKTVPDFETLLETGEPTPEQMEAVRKAQNFANVFRFKLFAPDGRMTYLSDSLDPSGPAVIDTDLNTHNPEAFAVLTSGRESIEIEDGSQKPNRPDYYAEVDTPVVVGDINHGLPRSISTFPT